MISVKNKIVVSVVLVLLAASLAVVLTSGSQQANSSDGILIDFGDRSITFVNMNGDEDSMSALEYACQVEGYELVVEDGRVKSINGFPQESGGLIWDLYVTHRGEITWTKIDGNYSDIIIGECTAVAWGLCRGNDVPTTAVDSTGLNYYSYPQATRVISLAPSCTETICAVGAVNTIIATDLYSNYPQAVVDAQEKGTIAIVGGFTNPSYELIVQQNPDMVICVGGQASHISVAEKLRAVGINVLVIYDGEDIDTILNNTHMVGVALGYTISAEDTINDITEGMEEVQYVLDSYSQLRYPSVMVSLSTVKSPWVSGSNTYVSDILSFTFCTNSYDSLNGWVQVNSESIMQYDPDCIIIVNSDYEPTEEAYLEMIQNMSAEWKETSAYKEGKIYLLTESATDLASRPATRVAQLTELLSKILHPEAFSDDIDIPKYVGDDYTEYLTYTKDLGFN